MAANRDVGSVNGPYKVGQKQNRQMQDESQRRNGNQIASINPQAGSQDTCADSELMRPGGASLEQCGHVALWEFYSIRNAAISMALPNVFSIPAQSEHLCDLIRYRRLPFSARRKK